MKLPKKCGDLWIKFDENNMPKYGFKVDGNVIKKFYSFTEKEIDTIVLPKIVKDVDLEESFKDRKNIEVHRYLTGNVKFKDWCFDECKNLSKHLKIVVPFKNSINIANIINNNTFNSLYKPDTIEWIVPDGYGINSLIAEGLLHYGDDDKFAQSITISDTCFRGKLEVENTFNCGKFLYRVLECSTKRNIVSHYNSKGHIDELGE